MNQYEKMFLAGLGLVSASAKEAKQLLKTISKRKISQKEVEKTFTALVTEGRRSKRESAKELKILLKFFYFLTLIALYPGYAEVERV